MKYIQNNILHWINCFLYNRQQLVSVNNVFSSSLAVYSGVPQGSVLGPLLFAVYTNDIVRDVNLQDRTRGIHLFADDAKLFSDDCLYLQTALRLSAWLNSRQFNVAVFKCKHICLHNKPGKQINEHSLNSSIILTVSIVKDLGITISYDLKWSTHLSSLKSAASLCAYPILHAFLTRNAWILLHAYITYVRPKLEYNTVIWSPYLKKDIAFIESVQKKFTRDICVRCNISFNSYFERLNKLNIKSLEYRRLEFDLIYMYKIFYDHCDVKFSDFFDSLQTGYNLRHHKFTVKCTKSPKLNSYFRFFCNRVPSV